MEQTTSDLSRIAPGCYAAPSVFSHDSDICKGCPAFEGCADACIETLTQLRSRINVESILTRHRAAKAASTSKAEPATPKVDFSKFLPSKREPTDKVERKVREERVVKDVSESDLATIANIPKKARELATGWLRNGLVEHIRTELQQGRNPFAAQARQSFMTVCCTELLSGALTKQSLKKAFMTHCGNKSPWDESTAASHVNIALPALLAFGIIQETSTGFVVVPASA